MGRIFEVYREFRRLIRLPLFQPFFMRNDNYNCLTWVKDWGSEYLIRMLRDEERSKPIWEILGLSDSEYHKDTSLGIRTLKEAMERFG